MRDDSVYLLHILECIRRIQEEAVAGQERFLSSRTVQDAVLRNLHTMTESTQRLSETLKARRPEVDWRRIAAFRNVLVHDYLGIDLGRVWEIVQRDVPVLKSAVSVMLDEIERDHKTGG